MAEQRNKRLISGVRVISRCSLDLPKSDPFDHSRIHRQGYMVFNTRGGALYLSEQFTDVTIKKLFKPNVASEIKNLTFLPEGDKEIAVGRIHARFLKFTNQGTPSGMVLRFVNLDESHLDLLNRLVETLPKAGDDENEYIRQFIN